jgi:hypothetical protein
MKLPFFYDVILCDPVSAAIGLGSALVGAAGSLLAPRPKAPAAPNVPPTPPPAQQPQGTNTSAVPQQTPSFLAAAAAPPAQASTIGGQGKTLLGQ